MKKKWLYTKNDKKQTVLRTNYYGRRLHRRHIGSCKYTYPSRILLHSLEQAAGGIGLSLNADEMEYMCYNQKAEISSLNDGALKLVDMFTYFGSNVSSSENDINMRLEKTWTAIDKLLIKWKSNLSDEIKQIFPNSGRADSSIWMYHVDTDNAYRDKS